MSGGFPKDHEQAGQIARRQRRGRLWQLTFQACTVIGIVALMALLYNIGDHCFGFVAIQHVVEPETLAVDGVSLERQTPAQLVTLLTNRLSAGLVRRYNSEQALVERTPEALRALVMERIVRPQIVHSWSLTESLLHRDQIQAAMQQEFAGARLSFRSWITPDFLTKPQASRPEFAGVRTAILGSLWIILLTTLFAFPIGVGAAIYLEEYAWITGSIA